MTSASYPHKALATETERTDDGTPITRMILIESTIDTGIDDCMTAHEAWGRLYPGTPIPDLGWRRVS